MTSGSGRKVAVVLLNWNGEKMLREYLPSVVEHTPVDLADIYVADNGSTDGSVALLRAEFPDVRLIEFPENYGFAEGYNIAIARLAPEYPLAVLLNSDVKVDSDWLTPLVDFMEAHPEVGAAQPKIMALREPDSFEYAGAAGGYLDCNGYPYCRGRIFDTLETDRGQYDTPAEIHWASGAALMVRTALYLETGGLDASFFAHQEEIDLCWRIRLMGYQIWAIPASKVFHLGGGTLPASDSRKTYLNFRNNLLMLHKNTPVRVRSYRLIRRRLLDALAWARFVCLGQWAEAGAILRAHRDYAKMRRQYTGAPSADLVGHERNILIQYYLRGRKHYSDL